MRLRLLLILTVLLYTTVGFGQRDSTFFFKTELSTTNNGFSIIPAFTLGAPAAFLDMHMGNKRWSFEPQFRFALEGRPWSFVFIYRYKAIIKPRFQLSLGGHLPGLNFVTNTVMINGIEEKLSVARRFLALEINPTYNISNKATVGIYFLRGHGFQDHTAKDNMFISLQGNFSKIKMKGKTYLRFNPQIFYLKLDGDDGFYVNATTTAGVNGFPITISTIVNKAIVSDIPSRDFDWNVSLVYTMDKKFVLR